MEEFLTKYIKANLHKYPSLFLGIVICVLFFSRINSFFAEIANNLYVRFGIYCAIIIAWIISWLIYKYKYPRKITNKIGLVVAIYAESSFEQIRLKNDFVKQLQRNINRENFSDLINIIILKNHLSEKLKTRGDIHDLAIRTGGHFFLFGDVKKRKDEGGKYFLNLEGFVIHKPIHLPVSNDLKKDFISLLPKEVSFLESFEFGGFCLTADIVYVCVKYITGLAAYLSGDPFLAIKLHTNLNKEFDKFKPLPQHLKNIKDKIPIILSNEKVSIARYYWLKNDIANSVSYIKAAFNDYYPNYGGWLLKAIQEFIVNNDPEEALRSVKKCKQYSNGRSEWRYSKAFLLFWAGRYKEALSQCRKIKDSSYAGEDITLKEVEKFNLDLLKDDTKPQLYFWIGYLNYKKNHNLPKALEYFEEFEKKADNSMAELKQKSSAYLKEIKSKMKLV
jgi:hypothetical protein